MYRSKNFSLLFKSLSVLVIAGMASCGSEKQQPKEETPVVAEISDSVQLSKFEDMYYSLPSPLVVSNLLKMGGGKFTEGILNPTASATKYTTNSSKALNLGVYGTDLAYANMFNQSQSAITYMDAVNKLGDGLGLSSVLKTEALYKRFEANAGNQDSLFMIIGELYMETDDYLKENEKFSTAALVVAGGWIEGLYIATTQVKNDTNKEIAKHIGSQKGFLEKLISVLDQYKTEPDFAGLISDFSSLKQIYDQITITRTEKPSATDEVAKMTTIGATTEVSLSDAQLKEISDKVSDIRSKITKV